MPGGMARQRSGRFTSFSEAELRALWEALSYDDGARYTPEPGVEENLLREIEAEMSGRDLPLLDARGRPTESWLPAPRQTA